MNCRHNHLVARRPPSLIRWSLAFLLSTVAGLVAATSIPSETPAGATTTTQTVTFAYDGTTQTYAIPANTFQMAVTATAAYPGPHQHELPQYMRHASRRIGAGGWLVGVPAG